MENDRDSTNTPGVPVGLKSHQDIDDEIANKLSQGPKGKLTGPLGQAGRDLKSSKSNLS